MKDQLRKLFRPLLAPLESGTGEFAYKRSHRTILLGVASLFLFLGGLSASLAPSVEYLFPVLVFGGAGLGGVIVASLGSDRAVARLWGSRHV